MGLKSNAIIISFITQIVLALINELLVVHACVLSTGASLLLSTCIPSDQDIPSSYYIALAPDEELTSF